MLHTHEVIMKKYLFALLILVFALAVAGCGVPDLSETAIPPTEAPATEVPPDQTPVAVITPDQVHLDPQGLGKWQAVTVQATPYDASQPPGPKGLPAHIEILFDGVIDPADRDPYAPVMYIIPVDAYIALWQDAGDDFIANLVDDVYLQTTRLPWPPPADGLPSLPVEEHLGVNDLSVQVGRAASDEQSASKNGYRFVGRFVQGMEPITSDGTPLRYIYQGFTNDGKYLVAFYYPVTTDALPTLADVQKENLADADAVKAYIEQQREQLNALSPADWTPNLTQLDALVGSLQIDGMVATGLQGQVWGLTSEINVSTGVETPFENIDPADYAMTFLPDGTMTYHADCNQGQASYTAEGGITGSLSIEMGPTTLAQCSPESLSQMLIDTLASVQSYDVKAGGDTLHLVRPAGGGVLVFKSLGPAQ